MDQRNAGGRSHAPITAQDGWHSYAADHIALLDHLGVEQCHLYGQCIGGPFIMSMLKAQPQRIASAVIAQPIGRVETALPPRSARFNAWAESLKDHPEVTEQVLDAFYENLYGPGFAYSVDRALSQVVRYRVWCWRETMRRIRMRLPRRWHNCSPMPNSLRSGKRVRP